MSVHIHECTRPSDDDYCASRGYCECECGAWQGESDDEWSLPIRQSLPRFTPEPYKLVDRLVKAVWTRSELLPDDPAEYQDFATEEVTTARIALRDLFEQERTEVKRLRGIAQWNSQQRYLAEVELERLRETGLTAEEARKAEHGVTMYSQALINPDNRAQYEHLLEKLRRISSLPSPEGT